MGKILEPAIKIEPIKIEVDNNQDAYDGITDAWGPKIPVIKVNEYVIVPGDILTYEFETRLNNLPRFSITVNDASFDIRKSLETTHIDTAIIFIGYKHWYHKFQGVITEVYSTPGSETITMTGVIDVRELFETPQTAYNDQTPLDIITDKCKSANLGLFQTENDLLSSQTISSIQTGERNIHYLNHIVQSYTDNIWMLDPNYYFYIGNIESFRKQPLDKFVIKRDKVYDPPRDIVISTNPYTNEENELSEDPALNYFVAKSYTINSNLGTSLLTNYIDYSINGSDDTIKPLFKQNVNISVGIGEYQLNTFSKFIESHTNNAEVYKSMINKTINDKLIRVSMEDAIYEIIPFAQVQLEIFLPNSLDNINTQMNMDETHSGKKTVIGYKFIFDSSEGDSNPIITQEIDLI